MLIKYIDVSYKLTRLAFLNLKHLGRGRGSTSAVRVWVLTFGLEPD